MFENKKIRRHTIRLKIFTKDLKCTPYLINLMLFERYIALPSAQGRNQLIMLLLLLIKKSYSRLEIKHTQYEPSYKEINHLNEKRDIQFHKITLIPLQKKMNR